MSVLRSAKGLVLKAANTTGISAAVSRSRWRQQRLLVLCYHGTSQDDEHEWSDLYVSQAHLESRLRLLRKLDAPVVPFDEAVTQLYAGTLPPNAVSITFDDGTRDFSSRAVPVLTAASAHSTLYLCSYYCRKSMPVFNPFVSYMLWKARGQRVRIPGLDREISIPLSSRDPAFDRMMLDLLAYVANAGLDADAKNELAKLIATACRVDFDELNERRILHLMNPAEVRALDPSLVDIQLHTHRHRTPDSLEHVQDELSRNAAEIRDMTGRTDVRKHFCYPSGQYSPQLVGWLATQGLRTATTCEPGIASRTSPPLEMPRFIDTMGVSEDAFTAWVSGTAEFTQMVRRTAV